MVQARGQSCGTLTRGYVIENVRCGLSSEDCRGRPESQFGTASQPGRTYSFAGSAVLSGWLVRGILGGTHQVQRDIRFIAHNPTVVAGRDVENVARFHLDHAPIIHRRSGASRHDQTDVFDVAASLPERSTHVL